MTDDNRPTTRPHLIEFHSFTALDPRTVLAMAAELRKQHDCTCMWNNNMVVHTANVWSPAGQLWRHDVLIRHEQPNCPFPSAP